MWRHHTVTSSRSAAEAWGLDHHMPFSLGPGSSWEKHCVSPNYQRINTQVREEIRADGPKPQALQSVRECLKSPGRLCEADGDGLGSILAARSHRKLKDGELCQCHPGPGATASSLPGLISLPGTPAVSSCGLAQWMSAPASPHSQEIPESVVRGRAMALSSPPPAEPLSPSISPLYTTEWEDCE